MPLADRTQRERDLAAAIAAALLAFRISIEQGTPDYPRFVDGTTAALAATLAGVYVDAANELTGAHETPSDGKTAEAAASLYAASVAGQIAQGMAETTRTGLADATAAAGVAATGVSLAGLYLFSAERAASVSITEITRAITQGEKFAAGLIAARLGGRVVRRWKTEQDANVCEICAPLEGRREFGPDGYAAVAPEGPPAHPRCRCELTYSFESLLAGV